MFFKLIKFIILFSSQTCFLYSANNDGTLEEIGPSGTMGTALQAVEQGYDSDVEYTRHQQVNERFFRRLSQKPSVRAAIQQFKNELVGNNDFTRINLDGLSSRSCIYLFRELTAAVRGPAEEPPKVLILS